MIILAGAIISGGVMIVGYDLDYQRNHIADFVSSGILDRLRILLCHRQHTMAVPSRFPVVLHDHCHDRAVVSSGFATLACVKGPY